jgi:catechol 2,3-dioxygenase-like lactoylglutathione lyase family enzyme
MPLGHLGINVADLTVAKTYYDAVMPLLGYEEFVSADDEFSYRPIHAKPGTFVFFYRSEEPGEYSRQRAGLQHLAFIVGTRQEVDAVRDLVAGLGSEVVHPPREFPQYHPGYYATFWLDPFGQMLEAVCHRDPGTAAARVD